MGTQALYEKALTSQIFADQAEAVDWGKKQKENYAAAGITVKADTSPYDPTRRRWITTIYEKV